MPNTICNVERLRSGKERYHLMLRDCAKKDARLFVNSASYGCLRIIPALRDKVVECSDRVTLSMLTNDEEVKAFFEDVFDSHPEVAETDLDGCFEEDGIVFIEAWLDEVCSLWFDISAKL